MIPETDIDTDGLRKLFLEQYAIHEVKHHEVDPTKEGATITVVPRAHALMDIYKCLYQGEFGPGYGVAEYPKVVKGRIEEDFRHARASDDEPVLEGIRPDGLEARSTCHLLFHEMRCRT